MPPSSRPAADDVEHLLRNAELRNELELLADESLVCVNVQHLPTPVENEFLASMLAWEQAPIMPIARWFEPELALPRPETLAGDELHAQLWDVIHKLFEKRIVLDFTDHLSDAQLYCLIYRDILPAKEKKLDLESNYLHWDCAATNDDADVWLRYYASEDERQAWADETHLPLPPCEIPPYPRDLPRAAL